VVCCYGGPLESEADVIVLCEFESVYALIVLKFVGHVILNGSKEIGPIIVSKE
jgi:hypothetical protein